MTTKRINLSCVIHGKDGEELTPEKNPHTVDAKFADVLIKDGLAKEAVGKKGEEEEEEADPRRFDNQNVDKKSAGSKK